MGNRPIPWGGLAVAVLFLLGVVVLGIAAVVDRPDSTACNNPASGAVGLGLGNRNGQVLLDFAVATGLIESGKPEPEILQVEAVWDFGDDRLELWIAALVGGDQVWIYEGEIVCWAATDDPDFISPVFGEIQSTRVQ